MGTEHTYQAITRWTGNIGSGTSSYLNYERSHTIHVAGKADIIASSDVAFLGDPTKHNPEDLLVSSLSSCHMLWYLHLCAVSGIIVVEYVDHAVGIMTENSNGGGKFKEVILNPLVTVTDKKMVDKANNLHKKANELCYIANSVNFPVSHKPKAVVS